MTETNPLLEQYHGLVNVIMNTDYTVKEYVATERQLASTLEKLEGKVNKEHLSGITKVTKVLNSEKVMVPLANTLGSIESKESFDYLLNQFLDCLEDGLEESATAEACYRAMLRIDPSRVRREGIDQHPYFL